jgi:hypothetical protein
MLKPRRSRLLTVLLLGIALLLPATACDREEGAPPPIVIVTPEPVRGVIAQTAFSGFQPGFWVSIEVRVTDRGKLDLTVDWTVEGTWMYVYLGSTECDFAALSSESCPFLIESETRDPKPRVLYSEILDAGLYYVYLYNVPRDLASGTGSDNTEAVSIQLGLTVGFDPLSGEEEPVRLGRPQLVAPPQL